MTQNIFAEWTPLLFMAFALGMDAFSVSLGLGMQMLRLKRIAIIGIVIGFFHTIMPLLGIILGKAISTQIGDLTMFAGGLLIIGIGSQMIFTSFNREGQTFLKPVGFGLFLLALTVSMDSFSVGLSLGLFATQTVVVLFLFGFMSMVLAWAGLLLGKKTHHLLGTYSEMLGGSILCGFGLYILFG
ncbi:MAG TPA: manganese efflux pump MntP family protein [Bacillota bacterium]|nr:manganese efflux pump MntP family protein [Bacillota bacterium]